MKRVTGIQMSLADGKRPGYYAQVIKGIADAAETVDRDRELLFVEDADAGPVLEVLDRYKVERETGPWLMLDEQDWETGRLWDDYGVRTRQEFLFLDLSLSAVVMLQAQDADRSELAQAELQLDEHRIASAAGPAGRLVAIDRKLLQLAEGIANAYRCKLFHVA